MIYRNSILRRGLLAFVLAAAVFGGGTMGTPASAQSPGATGKPEAAGSSRSPNFVLIVADDLGYGDVGYQGGKVPTPNIDSIAAGGVTLTDGYVTCPVCAPSRAGLLTGRYQQAFGFWDNIGPFRRDEKVQPGIPVNLPILSERLKDLGYTCGLFGKTHDGDAEEQMAFNRWDEFYGFNNGASNYLGDMNRLHNPIFHNKTIVSRPYAERGVDVRDVNEDGVLVRDLENYFTDQLGDMAAAFIDANADQPFLCYVPFNAIHGPFQAPKPMFDKYASVKDRDRRLTMAMLDSMDQNVGKVLEALRRNGLEEDTLVVFLSDNGGHDASINAPLRGKKGTYWEGGLRVPFCLQWKGVLPSGEKYAKPVISLDIMPTFIAAAGGEIDPAWQLDGVDLIPFMTGEKGGRPHETLYWTWGARKAIREGDLKVMTQNDGRNWEMFDLSQDMAEEHDLAPARSEKVQTLVRKHAEWESGLMPQQWGWNKELGFEDPEFGKPKPYHDPNYFLRDAALELNGIFSEHMVLQRGRPIPVYGTGRAGEAVEVKLGDDVVTGTIDGVGDWRVEFPAREASAKPIEMVVRSGGQEVGLGDLLVGDVWVCSGQSNMGWALFQTEPLPDTYAHADKLRLLSGKVVTSDRPQKDFMPDPDKSPNGWERADEAHALGISAVSYYMGREICEQAKIPVGIVVIALGGSQIWPWMTPASFEGHPEEEMARASSKMAWEWAEGQANRFEEEGDEARAERLRYQYKAKAPGSLYNAMMHPLTQMPIAGMLWYQGERSQDNPPPYRTLFPAAIHGWREAWGQGDIPFVFIQLPGYHGGEGRNELRARGFPLVREAQELALELPNTGMAMALEYGDYANVHPRVKNEVGRRAGLQALRLMGKDVVADGPVMRQVDLEGDTAVVIFDSVAGGLETRRVVLARSPAKGAGGDPGPISVDEGELAGFEVCGPDGVFVAAEARISGTEKVELRAKDVNDIRHVRYAFTPFPVCNLYSSSGLPARPFRTDEFPVAYGER
jgi:arylsulfatase A-like enzyme